MADTQDVDSLKRRGRRRLVGAIALVLLAVIVLPMVFDQEPRQGTPAVNIRIPREDAGAFAPKAVQKPPSLSVSPGQPVPDVPAPGAPKASALPQAPGEATREPATAANNAAGGTSNADRARAEAALANIAYIVPVAALSSPQGVKDLVGKLAAAKLPHYTEPVATSSGPVTRVRAGPFANREAAERARDSLKRLGLNPGNVTQRLE